MRVELFRRPARNDYGGTAAFDGGTIKIQTYEPFSAAMTSLGVCSSRLRVSFACRQK